MEKAIQVWIMAITAKLNGAPLEVEELARIYGCFLASQEDIDAASHMFNWNELYPLLEKKDA